MIKHPWTTSVLLGLALFVSGCEKKAEEPVSQSAVEQAPPSEGATSSAPGSEKGPSGAGMEKKPQSSQKQQRG